MPDRYIVDFSESKTIMFCRWEGYSCVEWEKGTTSPDNIEKRFSG